MGEVMAIPIKYLFRYVLVLALAGSLVGCYQTNGDSNSVGEQGKVKQQADPKLEKILATLQENPSREGSYKELDEWLDKNLIKGETTQSEFASAFGKHHLTDLDRPVRDNIITLEWFAYNHDPANHYGVVFQFDATTGKFIRRDITHSICGYCPHILANDGSWRLEGKLLAGCVGASQEGWDTLLLPRLTAQDAKLQITILNPAPEIEYINQVQLGVVQLSETEEVDVDHDGSPVVWKAIRELDCRLVAVTTNQAEYTLSLDATQLDRVLVLEVSNTSRFEQAMRDSILVGSNTPVSSMMVVRCDDGTNIIVRPVGTKFLRRVVVPLPDTARSVRIVASPGLWFMRRCWLGISRDSYPKVRWESPIEAVGPIPDTRDFVLSSDEKRLRLEPGEQASLRFLARQTGVHDARFGYVLRMRGYYDFLDNSANTE